MIKQNLRLKVDAVVVTNSFLSISAFLMIELSIDVQVKPLTSTQEINQLESQMKRQEIGNQGMYSIKYSLKL